MKEVRWDSPYQQEKYYDACQHSGLECRKISTGTTYIYFYRSKSMYIGWEIKPELLEGVNLPYDCDAYYLGRISDYNETAWDESSYYTYFTGRPNKVSSSGIMAEYVPRFRRSLSKSIYGELEHNIAETDVQVGMALEQFKEYPSRRNFMSFDHFSLFVKQLLVHNVADVHIVFYPKPERQICGSAIVLKSPTQTNLRYYTSQRSKFNPGHYLHHNLVMYYLQNPNYNLIDHSGITSPNETDPSLKGINDFKLQIKGQVAQFNIRT